MTTETETPATEPETPVAETPTPETPVVDTGAAPPEAGKDERSPAQKALDGFKEGVQEASPEKKDAPAAGAPVVAAPPPKKDGDVVVDKKPDDQKVEDEIKTLKLSGKTAERFRELSKRPTPEQIESQIAPLKARAEVADQWDTILRESTARPDQLNSALGYLHAINSGDPTAMNKAYDVMVQEVAWLGKQLGRDAGGLYDPLKDHPDLLQKVTDGEITREIALETARHRATSARTTDLSRRREETEAQKRDRETAITRGVNDLNELGRALKAADPQYDAKAKLLTDAIAFARENLEPGQWKGFIEREYRKIVLPTAPPPAAKPPVGHVPLRPTGTATGQQPHTKDPREAFKLGVAELGG